MFYFYVDVLHFSPYLLGFLKTINCIAMVLGITGATHLSSNCAGGPLWSEGLFTGVRDGLFFHDLFSFKSVAFYVFVGSTKCAVMLSFTDKKHI